MLSVSANVVDIPESFTKSLGRALHRSRVASEIVARNPDEPLRQFAASMLDRLQAMSGEGLARPYRRPEAFQADLQRISPSEREVLSAILRRETPAPSLELFQRSLVELGVLGDEGIRVPALADYLRQTRWRNLPRHVTDR